MQKTNIHTLCTIALFSAVISIMAQFSIPLPFGVPISLQNFAIALAGILLGKKNGTLAVIIYLLLGIIGLPVFANFRSGLQTILSPTGGFLIAYPIMAYLIGLGCEYRHKRHFFPLMMLLAYFIDYVSGTLIYCVVTGSSIKTGITVCVLPFLPTEIMKSILAGILGLKLRKRILLYL